MDKGTLTVYTASLGHLFTEWFPPTDPSRPIRLVVFVPPDTDIPHESAWDYLEFNPALWARGKTIALSFVRCSSTALQSDFTIWAAEPLIVNPWSLVDEYMAGDTIMAAPLTGERILHGLNRGLEDKILYNEVPDEYRIGTDIIVRKTCKDLVRLERSWANSAASALGEHDGAAFALAAKLMATADRVATIPNERVDS